MWQAGLVCRRVPYGTALARLGRHRRILRLKRLADGRDAAAAVVAGSTGGSRVRLTLGGAGRRIMRAGFRRRLNQAVVALKRLGCHEP